MLRVTRKSNKYKEGQTGNLPPETEHNMSDIINRSCAMLVSISKTIQTTAQSGIYFGVAKDLERAYRELQSIDKLIEATYEQQGLGGGGLPLHDRATPESNYLLDPKFHQED